MLALAVVPGCDNDSPPVSQASPDARLRTHVVVPSTPTADGLAYVRAVADLHARADAAPDGEREALLREGLARPVPTGLDEAEILRLGLAVRLAQGWVKEPASRHQVRELLVPMLRPDASLPQDRVAAEALIVLGDAAAAEGDDALAAGSYARSIRLMSLLRQEIEP